MITLESSKNSQAVLSTQLFERSLFFKRIRGEKVFRTSVCPPHIQVRTKENYPGYLIWNGFNVRARLQRFWV